MRRIGWLVMIAALLVLAAGCSAGNAENPIEEASTASQGRSASAAITTPTPPPSVSQSAPKPSAAASTAPAASPSPAAANPKTEVADGFYIMKLDEALKKRITGISYPADAKGLKISYGDLRYIGLKYYDFEGNVHTDGELIVNAKLASEVTEIFYELYKAKYPFTSVRLVDDYGEPGDDNLSMAANNTSAFNYRYVTGTKSLSLHSYGEAIDINPKLNPYIHNGSVSPANGKAYEDRSQHLPGMIDRSDLCFRLFTQNGWNWGGDTAGSKDYQHFSKKVVS